MIVVWLFLAVPWVCLKFVIMVFPDHSHLLFLLILLKEPSIEKALLTFHETTEAHFCFEKKKPLKYHAWSCQNVCDALTFLLDNILINLAPSCIDK